MHHRKTIQSGAGAVALALCCTAAAAQNMPGSGDWTGAYAGGQLGWGQASGDATVLVDGDGYDADLDGSSLNYGVTLGYRYDFGTLVLGTEGQFDWSDTRFKDVDVGLSEDIDEAGRLKDMLRYVGIVGYDGGRTLYYGAAGWARATIKSPNEYFDGNGWVIGGGIDYMLTDNVTVGGQVLYHQFDDIGEKDESFDLGVTRVQLKVAYRF